MSYNEMCSDGKHSTLQNHYYPPISSLPVTIVANEKKKNASEIAFIA